MEIFNARVLVQKPEKKNITKGGIYVPGDTNEQNPLACKVIEISEEVEKRIQPGNLLLISSFALANASRCIDEENNLYIVNVEDVLSKIETEEEIEKYIGEFKDVI